MRIQTLLLRLLPLLLSAIYMADDKRMALFIFVAAAEEATAANHHDHRHENPSLVFEEDDDSHQEISLERLSTFISYATSYLVRVSHTQQQDPLFPGRFTYEANVGQELQLDWTNEEEPQDDYNLLRHNGALYALSQSYLRRIEYGLKDDLEQEEGQSVSLYQIKQTLMRGLDYLKRDAILPVPDRSLAKREKQLRQQGGGGSGGGSGGGDEHPDAAVLTLPNMLAAWEKVDIDDPDSPPDTAKLGGAGLALIALAQMELVQPGTTGLNYMRQIANFIKYMQKRTTTKKKKQKQHDADDEEGYHVDEDGSFICKYSYKHGPDDSWTSLYYPGEAALGLVLLAEIETDEKYRGEWLETSTRALLYLERLRRYQYLDDIEPDHWALLATARILPLLDSDSVEYWLVYNHGVRVAHSMVASHTQVGLAKHKGCFTYDRRTCPTSTRLEGLLAALTFLRESEMFVSEQEHVVQPLRVRIIHDVKLGVRFVLGSQQTTTKNNMLGGVPECHPAKNDGDGNVRIDYPQHSMSAMIAYEQFLLEEQKKLGGRLGINHLRKLLPRGSPQKGGGGAKGAGTHSLWANIILMGSILLIGSVLVVSVFISPNRQRRRRLKKK